MDSDQGNNWSWNKRINEHIGVRTKVVAKDFAKGRTM